MGETIEELRRLQAVELKLAGIRRTRESRQRRLEVKLRHARQIEAKVEQNKIAYREQQVRVDALSLEIASREEAINKHRQALNKAKTSNQEPTECKEKEAPTCDYYSYATILKNFLEA